MPVKACIYWRGNKSSHAQKCHGHFWHPKNWPFDWELLADFYDIEKNYVKVK